MTNTILTWYQKEQTSLQETQHRTDCHHIPVTRKITDSFITCKNGSKNVYSCQLTNISIYRIQQCWPAATHNFRKFNVFGWLYALDSKRLISIANSSPPLPSNAGAALAELSSRSATCGHHLQHCSHNDEFITQRWFRHPHQSTKNSSLPSFGLLVSGTLNSALTPTNISVFDCKQ